MTSDDVVLRRALPVDALPAADVWMRSFDAALPSVHRAHDDAEVRNWFARVLVPRYETWVAVSANRVVGLLVLNGAELKQLFLDPAWRGRGLGDRFMSLAKQRQPDGLALRTFQVNEPAQRFYERHGSVEAERTDGLRNDEREPHQDRPGTVVARGYVTVTRPQPSPAAAQRRPLPVTAPRSACSLNSGTTGTAPATPRSELFHRAFTDKELQALGSRWAYRQTYSLSRTQRAVVLRDYG
ncbi:GNAT family N-acetyltransferase [Streptomyces sp. NPDC058678]|uniref:GNAT family N-acetyltransferase n=1 Tax=Streptomyces sp. NPDC058678 TaxID=3346595 RepID=UPI0036663C01